MRSFVASDGNSSLCGDGLFCNNSSMLCEPRQEPGGICGDGFPYCLEGLDCVLVGSFMRCEGYGGFVCTTTSVLQ